MNCAQAPAAVAGRDPGWLRAREPPAERELDLRPCSFRPVAVGSRECPGGWKRSIL